MCKYDVCYFDGKVKVRDIDEKDIFNLIAIKVINPFTYRFFCQEHGEIDSLSIAEFYNKEVKRIKRVRMN